VSTFTELKTLFTDRGWSRLSSTQQGQHINDAMHELDSMEPRWPYLLTSTTGTLPLVISDLLEVATMLDTTADVKVEYVDFEDFASWAGELTRTGTAPQYWYFTVGSTTSLTGYPVSTRTVQVVYWKVSPDLSAGSDTPLSPTRWHHLIVDIADRNASRNKKDFGSAEAMQLSIDRKLAGMRTDLLYKQSAGPSQVLVTDDGDY
jgi:hypothetical protein